jgi:hypothetical protein
MAIIVTCECGRKLSIKEEHAGKDGICPNCKRTFRIPQTDVVEAPLPAPRAVPVPVPEPADSRPERLPEATPDRRDGEAEEPREVRDHGGGQLPYDADFFVKAPREIGPVISASTTLRRGMRPWDAGPRLGLAFGVAFGGLLIGALIDLAANVRNPFFLILWPFGFAALAFGIAMACTMFSHTCTYVGRDGCARFVCSGDRDNLSTDEVLRFRDATELRTQQTLRYVNGVYQNTTYGYNWNDVGGRPRFSVNGSHKHENGQPPTDDPYHFARSAELAWTYYLLDDAYRQIEMGSTVPFNLSSGKTIRLGRGVVLFYWGDDRPEKWDADEMREAELHQGQVRLRHVDAKEGWFSSSGIYKFQFSELANAQLFFHLMEKVVGVPVR